jgi:hypothetical protein
MVTRAINEAIFRIDLNEPVYALVREPALACKKTGIYGLGHRLSRKALEKPSLGCQQ